MRVRVTAAALVLLSSIAGCSFLVDFEDAPLDDEGGAPFDGSFADVPDEGPDSGPAVEDAGDADVVNPCLGKVDGFNYNPNDTYARCCDASVVETTSNDHCGACFIKCNTGKGQSCKLKGPRYYCTGCDLSADCWSKCCSVEFGALCAASDCSQGVCDPATCKDGTHCVVPGDASNYCAY